MPTKFALVGDRRRQRGLAAAQRAADTAAGGAGGNPAASAAPAVNVGCVPKKSPGTRPISVRAARCHGLRFPCGGRGARLGVAEAERDAYILRLNDLYAANLARHKPSCCAPGRACRCAHCHCRGTPPRAEHIIIATGGRPHRPVIPGAELASPRMTSSSSASVRSASR